MAQKKPAGKVERRKKKRRKYLEEGEFRKLIETGKVGPDDKRSWEERRKKKPSKK